MNTVPEGANTISRHSPIADFISDDRQTDEAVRVSDAVARLTPLAVCRCAPHCSVVTS